MHKQWLKSQNDQILANSDNSKIPSKEKQKISSKRLKKRIFNGNIYAENTKGK